ncbi:MAG: DUF2202 domain-containing protein [Bacteroidetes bacterium]|nr:DUF2202 domain-containing protein [Bacteroidota bacterium]
MRILIVLLVLTVGLGCKTVVSGNAPTGEVNEEGLLFLYEEEKVARDVYDYFEALYEITPFVHISDSEQRHFETLEALVISLGIITEDEVIRNEAGIFQNTELQGLYDDFIQRGDESLIEALNVSAFIEEHDIIGLKAMLDNSDNTEVNETMDYLINASHNHLRAFNRNLDMRDVAYTPVLLDESYFNDIINSRTAGCNSGSKSKSAASCCQKSSKGQSQKAQCGGQGKGNSAKKGKGQCKH